jgi:glycosyltransferase involved in cell wall biosynthesis
MKLSVIVPVYNMATGGKLSYCIRSIAAQTCGDFEIIAVDDASTDNSFQVLEELREEFPELLRVYKSTENRKQGGARNIGIKEAKGEWLGFVDSDDWVAPEMYKSMLQKAEETGADVVGCNYSICYEQTMKSGISIQMNNDKQTGKLDEQKYKEIILQPGSMVVKIYKREIVLEAGLFFPEHIFYEDNAMASLWMLQAKHFERINEPYYYYYQVNNSTVHQVTKQKCEDRMTAMNYLIDKAKELGVLEKYKKEFEYKYAELYLKNTIFSFMQAKLKGSVSFSKRIRKGMLENFANFQENEYYIKNTNEEEKKILSYLMKSPWYFVCYYKALWMYRDLRKGKK